MQICHLSARKIVTMKLITKFMFSYFSFLMLSCATITQHSNSRIQVYAPFESSVYLDDEKIGEYYVFKRIGFPRFNPKPPVIRIEKTGFDPKEFRLKKEINPWIWGNFGLLAFAPVGFLIDYIGFGYERFTPLSFKVILIENKQFFENTKSKAYQDYLEKKQKSKDKEIMIGTSNLTYKRMFKIDSDGKKLPDESEVFGRFKITSDIERFTITPGTYKITAGYSKNGYKPIEQNLVIPGGGIGVICGIGNGNSKKTSIRFLHIEEENLVEFENIQPRAIFLSDLMNQCYMIDE